MSFKVYRARDWALQGEGIGNCCKLASALSRLSSGLANRPSETGRLEKIPL